MDDVWAAQVPRIRRSLRSYFNDFREARRVQNGLLAPAEKKVLLWLAARMPATVNSDHLTVIGVLGMLACGVAYAYERWYRWALLLAIVGLAVNWFGDSLDGTLARARNRQRPRYGFYVDHVADALCICFLFGGLGLSGLMNWPVAIGLTLAYLLLMIEAALATYTMGTFRISFFAFSPTELRILLAIGNLAILARGPFSHMRGHTWLLFDVGGVIGMAGMMGVFLLSAVKNGLQLYREERLD